MQTDFWDRGKIRRILLECEGTGLGYFRRTKWRLKPDRSLLTDADTEIEDMLASHFDRPGEGTYMIGEETVEGKSEKYLRSAFENTAFIVDPIDGTAPFAHGIPTWGIMIGYMRRGRLEEGAVILPSTGELVVSEHGANYISMRGKNGRYSPFKRFSAPAPPPMEGGLISVSQNIVREWNVAPSNPYQAVCCSAFTCLHLLFGGYLAYVGCSKLWDLAAALPILWNAGFHGRFLSGGILRPEIDERTFHLEKTHRRRWYLRDQMVLSANADIADYVGDLLRAPLAANLKKPNHGLN